MFLGTLKNPGGFYAFGHWLQGLHKTWIRNGGKTRVRSGGLHAASGHTICLRMQTSCNITLPTSSAWKARHASPRSGVSTAAWSPQSVLPTPLSTALRSSNGGRSVALSASVFYPMRCPHVETSRRRWPRELPVLSVEQHHFCQAADKWREHRPRGLRQLPQDTGSRQSRLAPAFVDPSASRSLSKPWPQIGDVARPRPTQAPLTPARPRRTIAAGWATIVGLNP
jgi:hypothetical protein